MGIHRTAGPVVRRLVVGTAATALVVGAFAPSVIAAGPSVAWQAGAGTSSRDQAVQVNAFLPRHLTVDVGDTITWNLNSGEFHTVTFLSGAAAPPLIVFGPNGPSFNLAAVAPSGGPTYDGTGIASSGLLTLGQQYTLGFSKAGSFHFLCLVHAGMNGTVDVQDAGAAYPKTQAQYDTGALVAGNRLTAAGRTLQARTLAGARSSGAGQAAAGTGAAAGDAGSLAVMRFLPGRMVIHTGQTVTWTNHDPETPHTITFGEEPAGGPLGAFAPSGAAVPGHVTLTSPDEDANSGVIGAGLPFGTTFTATFAGPGTYHFICALHDDLGMKGTIVVLP
ncbi:MAG TPA: plastocyanin/azurin family copper-binding protein [Candidatus Deferrimicrobium sp.]|nr:plastocyanin/azurin family copper-binding protein [Candidatus Deferrimicrobium sp.]